jgi:hypothetical protein
LCWLALPLIRVIENTTGGSWNNIREDLQKLHIGLFDGPAGTFRQRTELTNPNATSWRVCAGAAWRIFLGGSIFSLAGTS